MWSHLREEGVATRVLFFCCVGVHTTLSWIQVNFADEIKGVPEVSRF
jgi:hypothetical protein